MSTTPSQKKRGGLVAAVLCVLLAAAVVKALVAREANEHAAKDAVKRVLGPKKVFVTVAKLAPAAIEMTLPGTVRALQTTVLYARATGFVRKLQVNIGDKVRRGQLLANIEAPDVSAQLALSQARLKEAEENVGFSKNFSERTVALQAQGAATPQATEDALVRYNTARGAVASNTAEVQQLRSLVAYQRVTAPFDGTISKRMVDVGALVSVGATPIFEIEQTGTLRVDVDVPQSLAPYVTIGTQAKVLQGVNTTLEATVMRTTGALDPLTRNLGVQLALPKNASLLTGSYAQVRFEVTRNNPPVIVPSTALRVRSGRTQMLVVGTDNKVVVRDVTLGRDLGRDVEVLKGVNAGETLVIFAPTDLESGARVVIANHS